MITWCKWHRAHHKFTDTAADPHNIAGRGFFFAHMGWLLVRPTPEYMAKRDEVDVSDLLSDPVLAFQKK